MFAFGFLTVSSTDRIKQHASDAAVIALILTIAGSQTNASKLSEISSLLTSTPYQRPPEIQLKATVNNPVTYKMTNGGTSTGWEGARKLLGIYSLRYFYKKGLPVQ